MLIASDNKPDLWSLALDSITIDPTRLLAAMEAEAINTPHDFRTRVLLRDSFLALKKRWGENQVRAKLSSPALKILDDILAEELGDKGFASLERRLMEPTQPATIEQFLRELGSSIQESCSLSIGGSSGLILLGMLSRGRMMSMR